MKPVAGQIAQGVVPEFGTSNYAKTDFRRRGKCGQMLATGSRICGGRKRGRWNGNGRTFRGVSTVRGVEKLGRTRFMTLTKKLEGQTTG